MIKSGPNRASTLHLLGGSSIFARPFLPCQNSAVISFWNRGCCAPAATGMSQRSASETMRRALSRPCAAVTLPGTTVMARTSSSGELSASIKAMASSVPGSVSKIIFLAAGEAHTGTASSTTAAAQQSSQSQKLRRCAGQNPGTFASMAGYVSSEVIEHTCIGFTERENTTVNPMRLQKGFQNSAIGGRGEAVE